MTGPTPPGTGVMYDALREHSSKLTSPTSRKPDRRDSSLMKLIPTSCAQPMLLTHSNTRARTTHNGEDDVHYHDNGAGLDHVGADKPAHLQRARVAIRCARHTRIPLTPVADTRMSVV